MYRFIYVTFIYIIPLVYIITGNKAPEYGLPFQPKQSDDTDSAFVLALYSVFFVLVFVRALALVYE